MNTAETEIAEFCLRTYQTLMSQRGILEQHWEEIAERVWPSHSRTFNPTTNLQSKGDKRNQELYDSTAAIALGRFGAILDSLLTPSNGKWHRLQSVDPTLNKMRQVQMWFDQVNDILFKFRYAPRANFAAQNQQNYKSLGAFGSGCVFVDQLYGARGLRYRNVHVGELYFRENHQGLVDTGVRYFAMTVRQIMQRYPDKANEMVKSALTVNPDLEHHVIHVVCPREDRDLTRRDYRGMAYASYYVHVESRTLLEEKGYNVFPYAISRYEQAPGEVYGRSPAMDVLPAIKTLNEEKKTMLKAGHRAVDPVLLAHDDGIIDGFSLRPGAINAGGVTADGRPLVHALPTGRFDIGKEMMDDERSDIKDAFLTNIFQILVETPTMTATEVLERTREKGILLAPTIGRQQAEYLGPLIEREIDVLSRQGLLPPMPRVLVEAGAEYKVEYDSPLSRAQRADEAAGLMRTVELAIKIATEGMQPEALDFFDWDEIIPEVSSIQGVPTRWLKDLKDVQAVRQQRAQAQQRQEAMQAAPGVAGVMKAVAANKKAGGPVSTNAPMQPAAAAVGAGSEGGGG